jgi:hypothetical protein
VLYHGKSRDEMYRIGTELPSPKRIATHYTGKPFSDDEVYWL